MTFSIVSSYRKYINHDVADLVWKTQCTTRRRKRSNMHGAGSGGAGAGGGGYNGKKDPLEVRKKHAEK